jgi:hypothetical protein
VHGSTHQDDALRDTRRVMSDGMEKGQEGNERWNGNGQGYGQTGIRNSSGVEQARD